MRKSYTFIIWIVYKNNLMNIDYLKVIKYGKTNKNVNKLSQPYKGKIKNEGMIIYLTTIQ